MNRKKTITFEPSELVCLKDPKSAKVYLEACLAEGNIELFQEALRDVAKAQGGVTKLAKDAHVNRQHLYDALSKKGKPKMETMVKVLSALGLRFSLTTTTNIKHA